MSFVHRFFILCQACYGRYGIYSFPDFSKFALSSSTLLKNSTGDTFRASQIAYKAVIVGFLLPFVIPLT